MLIMAVNGNLNDRNTYTVSALCVKAKTIDIKFSFYIVYLTAFIITFCILRRC